MRRTITALVVAGALAALAGCGGGSSNKSSSSSSNSGAFAVQSPTQRAKETLSIHGFGKGDDVANNRAAPAKVQNPNGAYDSQKFLTQLAGGNIPDLVHLDRQHVATLAAKGTLMPLQGCVDAQHIDLSQFRKPELQEGSYDGKLYALPEFDPKIPEFLIMWVHANGAALMSADGKTVHFDDPKVVQALRFTSSLVKEEGGWNRFSTFRNSWDFFGTRNQVARDQVGFWPMDPFTYFGGSGWAIPAKAKNPSLACTWLKTMTRTSTWVYAAKQRLAATKKAGQPFTGLYTANAVADRKIPALIPKGTDQWTKAVQLLVQVQNDAVYWPASPAGAQAQQVLQDAINRVLTGQQTPAQALKQAQTQAQDAIDQAVRAS